MNKKCVLWFDDEFSAREPNIQFVAESLGLNLINALNFVQNNTAEASWPTIVDICADKCKISSISLIVVDDNLSALGNGVRSFSKGSSLCGALRDRFKDVPIVGVSNAGSSLIVRERKEEYSYFMDFLSMDKDESIELLRSMVKGFAELRRRGNRSCEDGVLALMKVPKTSIDRLRKVMPVTLRSGKLAGNVRAVFRWLNEEVFAFQGVLVDSVNIASMIGLKEEYFLKKIATKLGRRCKYDGVFASFWGHWFWRQEALMELAAVANDHGALELSHYCAVLAPRTTSQWAVCANCGQHYTELAADVECNGPREARVPAHRRCVVEEDAPHPVYFNSKYVIARGARR